MLQLLCSDFQPTLQPQSTCLFLIWVASILGLPQLEFLQFLVVVYEQITQLLDLQPKSNICTSNYLVLFIYFDKLEFELIMLRCCVSNA
jgi:hypothetical protein